MSVFGVCETVVQPCSAMSVPPTSSGTLARAVQVVVEVAGAHVSQAFAGFGVPASWNVPSMKHFGLHTLAEQTCPSLHDAPSARCVHVVVDVVGTHTSQGFAGFGAPTSWSVPPMKHFGLHAPAEQNCPSLHDVPSARCVHVVEDIAGTHCSHAFAAFTAPSETCWSPIRQIATQTAS
ncbi:hypothetical protein OV208_24720 [Corallococcus sp. bb12-1]|uniref:hypothetical protein n=1 Tax=Corallococcus sp. bb12-1 TaxID=2996784 RepID=UPI00226D89A6|nr:hypothetical protein [Corallococcus sp. bb12-1]MCY1044546.1 hypothetical protein [Corallococcus sp. bb12-1]